MVLLHQAKVFLPSEPWYILEISEIYVDFKGSKCKTMMLLQKEMYKNQMINKMELRGNFIFIYGADESHIGQQQRIFISKNESLKCAKESQKYLRDGQDAVLVI